MKNLKDKIVLITGATSGIGRSCAYQFAESGAKLIICARREGKLTQIANELNSKFGTEVFPFTLDVRNANEVEKKLKALPVKWSKIDILINNAGLARSADKVQDYSISDWEEMIDTNIKGLLYVTRNVVEGMVERKSGHIINLGSTAGHEAYGGGGVYCGTKHFVNAITKGFKIDLLGTGVRMSSVDPGAVETEFSVVRFHGDEEKAANVYKGFEPLTPDDVAEAILFVASRPPRVNINEIILTSKDQGNSFIVNRS